MVFKVSLTFAVILFTSSVLALTLVWQVNIIHYHWWHAVPLLKYQPSWAIALTGTSITALSIWLRGFLVEILTG